MQLITFFAKAFQLSIVFLLTVVLLGPLALWAQPPTIPYYKVPFSLSSGLHGNTDAKAVIGFRQKVQATGAVWIRLHFSDYNLGKRSYITITSLKDGAQQHLDSNSLQQWRNSTAIFNGDAVYVELHIAAAEKGVFIIIDELTVGEWVGGVAEPMREGDQSPESICGMDDRVSSDDAAVGRIMPIGNSAFIVSNAANLTVGHIIGLPGVDILQFNVPDSRPDGTPMNPPPEDQYPIEPETTIEFFNDGAGQLGNNWAVFETFANSNTGRLAVHVQGAFKRMSRDLNPTTVRLTGYGVDDFPSGSTGGYNSDSQTLQTDSGPFLGEILEGPSDVFIQYRVDTRAASTGGPVIDTSNNVSVGIHTDGGCTNGGSNSGTSFENNDFEMAIQTFPGANVVYADKGHPVTLEDGTVFRPFDTIGEAVAAVPVGGIISIVADSYNETLTINKAMTLTAPVGLVNIGI